LVDAVFLTPLPVRDQQQLVEMRATAPARGVPRFPVMWDVSHLLLERRDLFVGVSDYRFEDPYPFGATAGTHTVHIGETAVDGHFFDVLGVRPELGRLLRPDDDVPNGPDIVVLSDQVWRRDFGADPGVIGRLLTFAGGAHRIIGIAPPEFSYPSGTSAWTPVARETYRQNAGTPHEAMNKWGWFLVARLRPDASREAALVRLNAALRADSASDAYTTDWGVLPATGVVDRYPDVVLGPEVRPVAMILFGAVVVVLLIACTNAAGLVLARGIGRAPELAVRTALGASEAQLVGFLGAEPLLLGLVGGTLGVAIGGALIHATVALAPPDLAILGTARLDVSVLAFAIIATLGSVVAFGLAPAMRAARTAPQDALRFWARSITGGPLTGLARRTLVAAQVALALVVVSGAGVMSQALLTLDRAPLGFAPDHLIFFRLDLRDASSASSMEDLFARIRRFELALGDQLPTVPELGPMTTTLGLPFGGLASQFGGGLPTDQYVLDGENETAGRGRVAHVDHALNDYFGTMRIPIVRGRPITRHDDAHAPPAVVVSQSLADQAWPGQEPLGHRMRFMGDSVPRWWTVVGVAADTRYGDPAAPPLPTVYTSQRQGPWSDPWFVVRTAGDPARSVETLERVIYADPMFGVSVTTTGPAALRARLARPRALTAVFGGLAATALLLTGIGLLGMLTSYVAERRREIAVRAALGAAPAQIRALVLGQTITVAAAGVVVGAPLALVATRLLERLGHDIGRPDVLTLIGIAVVLLAVVALATYGPVARAARVDVRTALATE
jgi:putative ABC transport system permease protein